MDKIDLILIMSVNPGFGGQKFIPDALNKLRTARQKINESGRDIMLEIDGGVNTSNIAEIAAAGCDTFVAGSAVYVQVRTLTRIAMIPSSPLCAPSWPK